MKKAKLPVRVQELIDYANAAEEGFTEAQNKAYNELQEQIQDCCTEISETFTRFPEILDHKAIIGSPLDYRVLKNSKDYHCSGLLSQDTQGFIYDYCLHYPEPMAAYIISGGPELRKICDEIDGLVLELLIKKEGIEGKGYEEFITNFNRYIKPSIYFSV
jgi:hypothetical protein